MALPVDGSHLGFSQLGHMGYTEIEEKGTKAPKGFITQDVALFKLTSQWPILAHDSKHHWNPKGCWEIKRKLRLSGIAQESLKQAASVDISSLRVPLSLSRAGRRWAHAAESMHFFLLVSNSNPGHITISY